MDFQPVNGHNGTNNFNYLPTHGYPFHQQAPNFYYGNGHFNPSLPHFEPRGTELVRLPPAAPPTPPNPSNLMTHHGMRNMERYVVDTNIKHTGDIARMEVLAARNQVEIEQTRQTVRHDLRTLQSQLDDMRAEFKGRVEADSQDTVMQHEPQVLYKDFPSVEEMLERFDKNTVAQVYLEQAEVAEETAKKLRGEVRDLLGGAEAEVHLETTILEPGPMNGDARDAVPPFNGTTSPPDLTHAPARRAQSEKRSCAVEIKPPAPQDNDATPKAEAAKLSISDPLQVSLASPHTVGVVQNTEPWKPLAVRDMPQTKATNMRSTNTGTFPWIFLKTYFGGEAWSPGFYFGANSAKLPGKAYWILEAEYEPFVPVAPGEHGAKLTPFFNDTLTDEGTAPDVKHYMNTPVFIQKEGEKGYTYFGHYSQNRYSDKLDHERVMEQVPEKTREYWAYQLSNSQRPEWLTVALMLHFWPRPTYSGPIPTDEAVATPATVETDKSGFDGAVLEKRVTRALAAYAVELSEWERDARIKVGLLSQDALMEAFKRADADEEPGLRLWWEYLQCVKYDQEFYEGLVNELGEGKARFQELKVQKGAGRVSVAKARVVAASAEKPGGGKMMSAANGVQTVRPPPASAPAAKQPVTKPTSTSSKPTSTVQTLSNGAKPPPSTTATAKPAASQAKTSGTPITPQTNSFPNGDPEAAKAFQRSAIPAQSRHSGGHGSGGKSGGNGGSEYGKEGKRRAGPAMAVPMHPSKAASRKGKKQHKQSVRGERDIGGKHGRKTLAFEKRR